MIECLLRPSVAVHSGSGASQTFNGKKLFYFPFFPSSSSRLHRTFSSSTPYHRSEPSPSIYRGSFVVLTRSMSDLLIILVSPLYPGTEVPHHLESFSQISSEVSPRPSLHSSLIPKEARDTPVLAEQHFVKVTISSLFPCSLPSSIRVRIPYAFVIAFTTLP